MLNCILSVFFYSKKQRATNLSIQFSNMSWSIKNGHFDNCIPVSFWALNFGPKGPAESIWPAIISKKQEAAYLQKGLDFYAPPVMLIL